MQWNIIIFNYHPTFAKWTKNIYALIFSVQEAWSDSRPWPEHPQLRLRQPSQAWPGVRSWREELVPLQLRKQLRLPQGRPLHFPQAQQGECQMIKLKQPLLQQNLLFSRFTTGCQSTSTTRLLCPRKCPRRSRSTFPACQTRSWTPCGWAVRVKTPLTSRTSVPSSTCQSGASRASSTPTRTLRATWAPLLLFTSPLQEVSPKHFTVFTLKNQSIINNDQKSKPEQTIYKF